MGGIDRFKSFNDRYGFSRGDVLILALAEAIRDVLTARAIPDAFPAHIGGDDFVVLVPPEHVEPVAADRCARFDVDVASLYDEGDRVRGAVEVRDRTGSTTRVAIATLSIGIVLGHRYPNATPAQLASVAAEVKELAKAQPGSGWALDRRGALATGCLGEGEDCASLEGRG